MKGNLPWAAESLFHLHFTNISFEMKQDSICPSYFINISFQMKGHRPWAAESLFPLHFIMCHGLRSLYFFTFQHFFSNERKLPMGCGICVSFSFHTYVPSTNERTLTMGCGVSIPFTFHRYLFSKSLYIPFTFHKYLFSY